MARNDPQMNLRVPVELKEKIEKAAFENGRTITAEAVFRLEQSFTKLENDLNHEKSMQTTMIQILLAATKAYGKRGLEWSEIQKNLIEANEELIELIKQKK